MPTNGLALVQDGWLNLNTGLGDPTRDKRKSAVLNPTRLSYGQACNLYRGDKMAAKLVDTPAGEMIREWFDVLVENDTGGRSKKAQDRVKQLKTKLAFKNALIAARKTGGAGILVGADDGQKDPTKPLDYTKIKSIDWLTVMDASELVPAAWYNDLNAAKFGEPVIYRVQPRMLNANGVFTAQLERREKRGIFSSFTGIAYVHESRVLPFYGVRLSRAEMAENIGWGDTIYNRPFDVIQDFSTAFGSVAYTLSDFAQGVLKMKGLAAAIAAKGATTISNRMIAINLSKSVAKTMLIDAEGEEFKREALSFGSIPETLDRFCSLFAACADMPVSLLFGESPAGLNATGDSDIRWFYDHISQKQEEDVVPPAEQLVRMILCEGGQQEPKEWQIQCRPLWQLDEGEEATRRLAIAQADQIYANMPGGATGEEIITTRFGGAKYNADKINLLETDPAKRALAAEESAEAEAEMEAQKNPQVPAAADKEPKDKP